MISENHGNAVPLGFGKKNKDVITFEGNTEEELQKAFCESVDDYLEFCKELESKK